MRIRDQIGVTRIWIVNGGDLRIADSNFMTWMEEIENTREKDLNMSVML